MALSLHTLPIEIVYRIFDQLHDAELFVTLQNVCQRLNAILDSYQRFKVYHLFLFFFAKVYETYS